MSWCRSISASFAVAPEIECVRCIAQDNDDESAAKESSPARAKRGRMSTKVSDAATSGTASKKPVADAEPKKSTQKKRRSINADVCSRAIRAGLNAVLGHVGGDGEGRIQFHWFTIMESRMHA
jgi:hypothetical protein